MPQTSKRSTFWQQIVTTNQAYRFMHPHDGLMWLSHITIESVTGASLTLTWDQLQAIKEDEIGNRPAIEYYPDPENIVNETNRRHLWEIPTDLAASLGFDMTKRA